jgi:hypothetical protein
LKNDAKKIAAEVNATTIAFVMAVKRIVKSGNLPPSPLRVNDQFPYALELLRWVMRGEQPLTGELGEIFNPVCGEDLIMGIACDIEYALYALQVCDTDIPEWVAWNKACAKQAKFNAKRKK